MIHIESQSAVGARISMNFHALAFFAFLAICSCRSVSVESDVKLIGGAPAVDGAFPATVMINAKCTAARIGEFSFLFAGHCLYETPDRIIYNMAAGNQTTIGFGRLPRANEKIIEIESVIDHPMYQKAMKAKAKFKKSAAYRKLLAQYNAAMAVDSGSAKAIDLENQLFEWESTVPPLDVPDLAVIKFKKTDDLKTYLNAVAIATVESAPIDPAKSKIAVAGYGCDVWEGAPTYQLNSAVIKKNGYRLDQAYILLKKGKVQGCQGDSGGSAFLHMSDSDTKGHLRIVGINSFTSRSDVDHWTGLTRVDDQIANGAFKFIMDNM